MKKEQVEVGNQRLSLAGRGRIKGGDREIWVSPIPEEVPFPTDKLLIKSQEHRNRFLKFLQRLLKRFFNFYSMALQSIRKQVIILSC
jgi:hypothetical protein